MKKLLLLITIGSSLSWASEVDQKLIDKLKEAKMTLAQSIEYAELTSGIATSAKFELKGENLVFSVYTAPQGLAELPEKVELSEILGSATQLPIEGQTEVFEDRPHLLRASSHFTLRQLSPMSLKRVLYKANKTIKGFPFSVKNPKVESGHAIAEVLILNKSNKVVSVKVNLLTGIVKY